MPDSLREEGSYSPLWSKRLIKVVKGDYRSRNYSKLNTREGMLWLLSWQVNNLQLKNIKFTLRLHEKNIFT